MGDQVLVGGEWWDEDEWEEHTRTHVWVHGQWWDRAEWEEVNRTDWLRLSLTVVAGLLTLGGAVLLIFMFWDWLIEWVPVIVGVGLGLVILIAAVASRRP